MAIVPLYPTSAQDLVAKTGTLTFWPSPGETTKTITIEVKGDSKQEANETFYLDLRKPAFWRMRLQQFALHQEPRHRHDPERRLTPLTLPSPPQGRG
jgi:hypothetical protein